MLRSCCTPIPSGGITLYAQWTPTAWSVIPSPNVMAGGKLDSVSCLNQANCTAVGYSWNGGVHIVVYDSLVESWNGTDWSIIPSPNPSGFAPYPWIELKGISCLSTIFCTAVGSAEKIFDPSTEQTLVESWNGTKWSIIPSPNPSGSSGVGLNAISCVSATHCTAVGGSSTGTLVESWNGTKWSIIPSPNPSGASGVGIECDLLCLRHPLHGGRWDFDGNPR